MKIVIARVALAVALVFTATSVLYVAGPTTKTVIERGWQPRSCPGGEIWLNSGGQLCPGGYAKAHHGKSSITRRTSAWERISGAVTGAPANW